MFQILAMALIASNGLPAAYSKGIKSTQLLTETCCDTLMVENFDGQTYRTGKFKKGATMYNDHPVYTCTSCAHKNELWYGLNGGWNIGANHTKGSYGIKTEETTSCPEDAGEGAWTYYAGEPEGTVLDPDANVRCSNCSQYPTKDECATCCPSVGLGGSIDSTLTEHRFYSKFLGNWSTYTTTPVYNERPIYKHTSENFCLYFSKCNQWSVSKCSKAVKGSCSSYMRSGKTTKKCIHGSGLKGTWSWSSNSDSNLDATCLTPRSVDGSWSEWKTIGECSETCGDGVQTQERTCDNPEPMNGGNDCVGEPARIIDCDLEDCPVDGGWSEWTSSGSCSKTCGMGEQVQTRTCDNPVPMNGGDECLGETSQTVECNIEPCSECLKEKHTIYARNNIKGGIKRMHGESHCAEWCFEHESCNFWTYGNRICWLKSKTTRKISKSRYVSGNKECGREYSEDEK